MLDSKLEINPVDKLDEILSRLGTYDFEVHKSGEHNEEYKYLENGCVCITILNPYQDNKLFIDLDDEFTLTYCQCHCHYFADIDNYMRLMEDIYAILKNDSCSSSLYCGNQKEWLGSSFIQKSEIEQPVEKNFHFVLKISEFKKKLNAQGGKAEYLFWNPVDDRTVNILPKKKIQLDRE